MWARPSFSKTRWQLISLCLTLVAYGLLYTVMPIEVTLIGTLLAIMAVAYVLLQRRFSHSWIQTAILLLWPVFMGAFLVWGGWLVRQGKLGLLSYLFIVPLGLVFFQFLMVIPVAFYQSYTDHDHVELSSPVPTVSAIIPAYNEEKYVGRVIESLLAADYPQEKLEVILVDDGSTDDTLKNASAYTDDRVQVYHKENGGKYSALNYGLMHATGEVIVTIDADCIVGTDAIKQIVAPFQQDASVGAVAGDVRVLNRHNFVTRMQVAEYSIGINLFRRMFDWFGHVPVVPGCLGAFRRSALEAVNNYDPDTLTEDYDLTIKLLKAGYDVRASPARTYTEVPDTWHSLYRQRLRWYRGNLMTQLKHGDIFLDPKYGILHSITFPLRMLAMIIGPLTTCLVLLSIGLAILSGAVQQILVIFGIFMAISTLSSLLALQLKGTDINLVIYTLLLSTVYKLFRDLVTLKAAIDVLLSSNLSWTSATRIRHRSGIENPESQTDGT